MALVKHGKCIRWNEIIHTRYLIHLSHKSLWANSATQIVVNWFLFSLSSHNCTTVNGSSELITLKFIAVWIVAILAFGGHQNTQRKHVKLLGNCIPISIFILLRNKSDWQDFFRWCCCLLVVMVLMLFLSFANISLELMVCVRRMGPIGTFKSIVLLFPVFCSFELCR